MEKALPGMRSDSVAEERRIGTSLEPISASVLLIGPPDGQLVEVHDRVVDDRSIAHGRSDDPVSPARQSANDLLEAILLDGELAARHFDQILIRLALPLTLTADL